LATDDLLAVRQAEGLLGERFDAEAFEHWGRDDRVDSARVDEELERFGLVRCRDTRDLQVYERDSHAVIVSGCADRLTDLLERVQREIDSGLLPACQVAVA